MSNRFYASIKIFGDVKESCLGELYDTLKDEFNYSNGGFNEKGSTTLVAWFKKNAKSGYLEYNNSEANWGEFEDLESFLHEHKIQFIRESSGDGGDCEPEVVYFNGEETVEQVTDSDNCPVLNVLTAKDILTTAIKMEKELKEGNAPLFANEEDDADTVQSCMAKCNLKHGTINAAELTLAYLKVMYPDIPSMKEFPKFKIVKG